MTIDELKTYKKILILGYGVEGKSTEKFIQKYHPDAEISIADKNDNADYLNEQTKYDLVIKTPGIRKEVMTQKYTTATNLFFGNCKGQIIGITGTKGKSTASTLVHNILLSNGKKSVLLGNIGDSMLDALTEDIIDEKTVIVMELSSYQLEDINYSPHIACILNIFHELHNHLSYEDYFTAKTRILSFQNNNDYFIYNDEQPELRSLVEKVCSRVIPFIQRDEILKLVEDNAKLIHNIDVVAASWTIARLFNISNEEIKKVIYKTPALPHRLEYLGKYKGINFYDDSAANHPEAVVNALKMLGVVSTIILGGQDRDFYFDDVVRMLAEKNIPHIILFPETQDKIQELIQTLSSYNPQLEIANTMDEAVAHAYEVTPENGICLLSPGAPSYLMFKNFNERGEAFQKCIRKYAQKTS